MPNSNEVMQRARSLWEPFAARLSVDDTVYERLAGGYSEPSRYYHSMDHVVEMLDCLAQSATLAADRDVVELAVWFHDVVYDSTAEHGANETASAKLLAELCSGPAVSPAYAIIEHSTHHGPSDDPDTQLFCDLDLYRLAGNYEAFLRHGEDVRREYAWIADDDWQAGRARFMTRLQERPSIYQTDFWRDRLEDQAQSNIARLLAEAGAGD